MIRSHMARNAHFLLFALPSIGDMLTMMDLSPPMRTGGERRKRRRRSREREQDQENGCVLAMEVCSERELLQKHGLRGLTHQHIFKVTHSIPYFLANCNIFWQVIPVFLFLEGANLQRARRSLSRSGALFTIVLPELKPWRVRDISSHYFSNTKLLLPGPLYTSPVSFAQKLRF